MGHKTEVWPLSLSPDGTRLASGSSGGTIKIWPVHKREPPGITLPLGATAGLSEDGSRLIDTVENIARKDPALKDLLTAIEALKGTLTRN